MKVAPVTKCSIGKRIRADMLHVRCFLAIAIARVGMGSVNTSILLFPGVII